MNKVLIVTYYWPPSGGAGVQRWLKFSKYLPEFGWEPIILTIDPSFAAYPLTDQSLMAELPSTLNVHFTPATNYFSIYKKDKSKIPSAGFANNIDNSVKGKLLRFVRGNFFLPDPRIGWNRYAFKKACELIESEGIRHIITTSPPHSSQLVGLRIKKRHPEIRWIADLRDPWTDIYYYKQFYPTFISKSIDLKLEKNVLKNADRIITVGNSLKNLFSSKLKGIEKKIEIITNGFDESDFQGVPSQIPEQLTLTYVGTLSDVYPVEGLITALKSMNTEGRKYLLRFVGSVSDQTKRLIASAIPESSLEFLPYVSHREAIKYMTSSSLLVLIIPLHPGNKSILTGKLFEYIAAGKPILCLGPKDGDAAEIIRSTIAGTTVNYFDYQAIETFIQNLIPGKPSVVSESSLKYSRIRLTNQLAEILKSET